MAGTTTCRSCLLTERVRGALRGRLPLAVCLPCWLAGFASDGLLRLPGGGWALGLGANR